MRVYLKPLLCILTIAGVLSCSEGSRQSYQPEFTSAPKANSQQYIFGVHPLHNPQRLHEVFDPLMGYLSDRIEGVTFKLEASRDYASYDAKLYAKTFEFSLPNPFQTINAEDIGYIVFAKMGDDENFRGIFLVRRDSNIQTPADLRGKIVSYPAPTALAATMLPQFYLHENGVDVMGEIDNRYVGSQESSIMNVYLGHSSAAATWPPPWRALSRERPELERELRVIWQTRSLPNNGVVALPSVPKDVRDSVAELLSDLHNSETGRLILERMELSKFEKASSETYQPVRDFVREFSEKVRPIEQ